MSLVPWDSVAWNGAAGRSCHADAKRNQDTAVHNFGNWDRPRLTSLVVWRREEADYRNWEEPDCRNPDFAAYRCHSWELAAHKQMADRGTAVEKVVRRSLVCCWLRRVILPAIV